MKTVRQALKQTLAQYQPKANEARGFLGLSDNTIAVPGKSHYVYVRLWNGEIVEAFNNHNVPPMPGLAVKVLYRLRHYEVDVADVYDQPVFRGLPDGAEDELQWPGSHTLYVRPEQFLPGLVYPYDGLTVYVAGGRVALSAGGFVSIPAQTVDLSSYVPASDAQWATIELMEDGTIWVEAGGAAASVGELLESDIPTSGSGFPLAAVKMYNGQTEAAQGQFGSDIVDLRFFQRGASGGGGSIAVEEQDGTPSVSSVTKIKVSNGTLSDDGGGVVSLETGSPIWGEIAGTLANQTDLQSALDGKAASSHTHDDRYYTESEADALLGAKADAEHEHAAADISSGAFDGDRLPALSTTKRGGAPATGTPSGKFLRDDDSWAAAVEESTLAARVYNSADLSISDSAWTALTFDSETFDDGGLHSTASNTGRLTAPEAGLYAIGCVAAFATNTSGYRAIRIRKNGSATLAQWNQTPVSGTWTLLEGATLIKLSAGDYVEVEVYQNSGGSLAVKTTSDLTPLFWMARIAVASGMSGATFTFDASAQTLGASQNRNTTSSFAYQQQSMMVLRHIKLEAIHVYIRTSGNYTVTLSNAEGTTLATKALTGVTGGAVVEFELATYVIVEPGYYAIKINSDGGSVLWSDYNSGEDQYYGAFALVGKIWYGSSQYSYRAPIQLEFYDSTLTLS